MSPRARDGQKGASLLLAPVIRMLHVPDAVRDPRNPVMVCSLFIAALHAVTLDWIRSRSRVVPEPLSAWMKPLATCPCALGV